MKACLHTAVFLSVLCLMSSCSPTIKENAEEQSSNTFQLPIHRISFNPSLLSEEWVNVILSDYFNGECHLENHIEIYDPDEIVQIVFVASSFDGLGYYQLLDSKPEAASFTLSEVGNSKASAIFKHLNSGAIDFYRMYEFEVVKDGVKELVIGAEITGTAHNDEGMIPYHMIVFDVLVQDENGFVLDERLTRQFNSKLGIDVDSHTNEPLNQLLAKKYYSISKDATEQEARELMKNLLDDMGVAIYLPDDYDHEFATVSWKKDHYVINMHWLASGYYFIPDPNNGFGIAHISRKHYPLLYIVDREVDEWQITDAIVKPDSITFTFRNLQKGSDQELNGTFIYDSKGRWLFRFDGYHYMMTKDREGMEVVGLEPDQ